MKILVVDDSPTVRRLIIGLLGELDYIDTVEAQDGAEAFQRLSEHPDIKLILLDRYMPNMDGLQFLAKFKQNPAFQYICVSMATSEDDTDEKLRAVADFQADYYITKPITRDSLVRMFARLFSD